MPTYVYRCSECETVFEAFQRITADPLTDCPNGHHGTVKRVIQPVAIAFSGSGFHINDYAAKPTASESGSSESAPAKSEMPAPSTPAPAAPAESGS